MTPNEFVKSHRTHLALTLKQAEGLSGIDAADLSRIERGMRISDGAAIKLHFWTGKPIQFFASPATTSTK